MTACSLRFCTLTPPAAEAGIAECSVHAMTLTRPTPQSRLQTICRRLLGLMLLFAGVSHLTWARTAFQAQVPRWVPWEKDLVVLLSGVVELGLGAALSLPYGYRFPSRYCVAVGWAVASFFVAVFPGNISQYVNRIDAFGLNTDTPRFVRLFFQPVLVAWALWSCGVWQRRLQPPTAAA